ncbi:MAG: patatin-like phospholipase family protein [Saprospiraceae bacterium]
MRQRLKDIFYSFPFQLLILHIRSNHLLLALWIIFALLITGVLGKSLGFQYLFLDPEYLGSVNFWSFYFVGVAFGGFYMTWHLTTYLLSSYRFPFLATLGRPFAKFCFNNSILPLAFIGYYLFHIIQFQNNFGNQNLPFILFNCIGLISGMVSLIVGYSLYFQLTNRDISRYENNKNKPPHLVRNITPGRRGIDIEEIRNRKKQWRVDTYLTERFRPRLVRSVAHYDSHLLQSILKQNHLNALFVQLGSMILLVVLGGLVEYPAFRIPAGASLFILASILVAIAGAVTYWFHAWRITIFFVLLIIINFLTRYDMLSHTNKAYGMDYTTRVSYSNEKLNSICDSTVIEEDKENTLNILEKWKLKNIKSKNTKPKLVIFSVSGGGLKAATWSMQVMHQLDSLTQGSMMNHTALITGASGGILGTAYLREVYLRSLQQDPENDYIADIGKDLLNAVAFTLVSNDIFLPYTTFEQGNQRYYKDRGYIFERQLNENTHFLLDKKLSDYRQPEQNAEIPLMFITPSIVDDARRLIISPQGVSYMMIAPLGLEKQGAVGVDAVDFRWLFKNQKADSLCFTTALRMNATYPYVLPNVHLPSEPAIEVLDAGFRDNFGLNSATRFIQIFKDWILENTSGVILVQISSTEKNNVLNESEVTKDNGLIESLFNPIGIAGQIFNAQKFEHDNSIGFVSDILGTDKFDIIRFIYQPTDDAKTSATVSFHITERERQDVLNSFYLPENQEKVKHLINLLDN